MPNTLVSRTHNKGVKTLAIATNCYAHTPDHTGHNRSISPTHKSAPTTELR